MHCLHFKRSIGAVFGLIWDLGPIAPLSGTYLDLLSSTLSTAYNDRPMTHHDHASSSSLVGVSIFYSVSASMFSTVSLGGIRLFCTHCVKLKNLCNVVCTHCCWVSNGTCWMPAYLLAFCVHDHCCTMERSLGLHTLSMCQIWAALDIYPSKLQLIASIRQ